MGTFCFYYLQKPFMMNRLLLILFSFILLQGISSCGEQGEKKTPIRKSKIAKLDSTGKFVIDTTAPLDADQQVKAAKVDQLMKRLYQTHQFNGAVLVGEEGKILYKNAFGYANFATKAPLSIHSSFHLASVSKQFTAMAVMMLKEEGKLNYDDDIRKYIPEIPYEGITIRHLLNHTSGIPNILNYIPNYMNFWDSCEIARNHDVAYMLGFHKPSLSFKPGNRFSYNNTGYVLLALIVERVSKIPFDTFMEKRIFQPLNMEDTKIYSMVKEPSLKERAYGYGVRRAFYSLDEDDIRNGLTGEKGVYSSVMDLYKWDQALYTDFLVKDTTLKQAFSYTTLNNGRKVNYGFGWRKSKETDQIVYHFGHWRGFNTCIIRFVDDHKVIIILNNTGNRRVKYLAKELIKILYGGKDNSPEF
jgi:CubicO group peptidase (beta-lactamase class C family)